MYIHAYIYYMSAHVYYFTITCTHTMCIHKIFICVYIHIYVYIYMYIYVYIYKYMYTYKYLNSYIYIYIYIYIIREQKKSIEACLSVLVFFIRSNSCFLTCKRTIYRCAHCFHRCPIIVFVSILHTSTHDDPL